MSMIELALSHAARGFKVFPIRAGAKAPPIIKDWELLATCSEATIRTWWAHWPEANVGIHCDGLLVLDVDAHKDGFASLAALEQEIPLEATLEVQTPRGGRHLFYRCDVPIANGVDVFGRGIDVRTTNGYVVAAGSHTADGDYAIVADEPIADADPRLVERAHPRRRERNEPAVAVHTDPDAAVRRAVDFLRHHPAAVQGQGGDFHTFRTVCRIRDFGVPAERAAEALEEWNGRCNPPWDHEELAVKIGNAYAYAQNAPGKLAPEAMGFEVVDDAAVGEQPAAVEEDDEPIGNDLIHPADVDAVDVLRAEYLIKGVLEKQSNAVLFGIWNAGKTFVVLDMGASIACGQEWFGHRVRAGRVMYLGYEGLRAMKKRMVALRGKYPALQDKATPFEYAGLINPLTRPEGLRELGARLKEFAAKHGGAPDLLIIDPLANALGGDDSDATLMAELNRVVSTIMKKQKCTVLRVHHSGHGNQERARGHSSLPAGVDTEIRVGDGEIALSKQRDDVKGKHQFKLTVVPIGTDPDGDPVSTCTIKQVEMNALDPELAEPHQELLNNLLDALGDGGTARPTDIRAAAPDVPAARRKKLVEDLVTKKYLVPQGKDYVIAERGPMGIFD
jgi:hypothetical protein